MRVNKNGKDFSLPTPAFSTAWRGRRQAG